MLNGQSVHVVGVVVVDDHFPVVSPPEEFLALPGGGQIGEARFSQLQPAPVEPIRAVHVDGTSDVVHVVQDERSTIEENRCIVLVAEKTSSKVIRGDRLGPLQHQLPLQGVVLRARTRG